MPRLTYLLSLALLLPLACTDDAPAGADEAGETDSESSDSSTDTTETSSDTTDSETSPAETVLVRGDAFAFGPSMMIADATVSVLELPGYTTTTDAEGHFELELPGGGEATFVFERAGYPRTFTKTFTLPASGTLERVSFQVPDDATFGALATIVMIEPDPSTCQLATTVTRVGVSLYDGVPHGEEGATVSIEPALPAELGPIYFNESAIPSLAQTETSPDGGVLYVNLPVGVYTLTASKPGVEFEAVKITCEAGVLVNASPPHGLQAL